MVKQSAGILMYRRASRGLEVFIVHPGGPFWKGKDAGVWSVPKGEVHDREELLDAAVREMKEETGINVIGRDFLGLGNVMLRSGKIIHCWATEGDWSGLLMGQSMVHLEFPKGSGKMISFPEVDKAGFFLVAEAWKKLHYPQTIFLNRLEEAL